MDCSASIKSTQEVAAWVKPQLPASSTLNYFICTHAHADHFLGLPVLEEHFPGLKTYATKRVVERINQQQSPAIMDALWKKNFFPSEDGIGLPEAKSNFKALPESNEFIIDGYMPRVYDVSHGNTQKR